MSGVNMKLKIEIIFLTLLMTSCAAPYNKNFPLIEKGMSLAEVTSLIGKPISAESGPDDSKVLYYRLASSPLDTDGSDTREYFVVTIDGKVVGYGERIDSITVMREARQFTAAWRAARSLTPPKTIPYQTPSLAPTNSEEKSSGNGATCFKKREWVSGTNRNCVYDCFGSEAVQTVSSFELCAQSMKR